MDKKELIAYGSLALALIALLLNIFLLVNG